MKVTTIIIFLFLFTIPSWAEDQIILKGGYHAWTESGWTFAYSETKDKEFNGLAFAGEYLHFWNNYGLSVSYLKHLEVKKTIDHKPEYIFTCNSQSIHLLFKYRKPLVKKIDLLVGVGPNIYFNDLDYGSASETQQQIGITGSIGIDYWFTPKWKIVGEVIYGFNRASSNIYENTNWNVGGLYLFTGIGWQFK